MKVHEIKAAIGSLPAKDFARLRQWFAEKDWKKWDREIKEDARSDRLGFLIREAYDEKHKGKLKDL
jgi:hypothetical protein